MRSFQALLAVLACAVLPLHAADLDDLTWTTTNGEVTITDCNEDATGELVIPDTIEDNPVTSIGDRAFRDCASLTSITIPNGVTSIGREAFSYCSSLTSITISDSVTSIENGAFRYCTSLTTFEVGAGNVNYTVVNGVLFNAEKTVLLTYPAGKTGANYNIPDSVTRIGEDAFFHCSNLARVTIPDSVTTLGNGAFYGCTSLTGIVIPDSVTETGIFVLGLCFALTEATLSGGMASLGSGFFIDCTSLTSITIPGSVTSIGPAAFYNCTSLTSVTISDSVTSIGDDTFFGCTSLASVTIPDSVTSIGGRAFSSCSNLTSITFLGAAPTVGVSAFFGVSEEAQAIVNNEFADSFGGSGSIWEGLIVSSFAASTIEAGIATGSGSVVGGGRFTNGSSVSLTATPAAGQVFIAWTGDATGSANPLTLTVEGDMNIGAVFIEPASHGLVTQASYDAVVAERDARFTEDQIHAMSANCTIGLNEAGNVQIKINLFESSDLATFAPFTVNPESVSVVDGSICFEFAPTDNAAFFRFSVQ